MRKLFTSLFTMALFAGASLTASAAEIGVELNQDQGTAQANTLYSIETPGYYYKYNPSESGLVTIQTTYKGSLGNIAYENEYGGYYVAPYFFFSESTSDPNTCEGVNATSATQNETGWAFIFNLSAGTTYVIGYPNTNTQMNTGFSFTILTDEVEVDPASINEVEPAPGEIIDSANYNDILIKSENGDITYGTVTFKYGTESIQLGTGNYSSFVTTNGYPEFLQIKLSGIAGDVSTSLLSLAENAGASSISFVITDVKAGGVTVENNLTGNSSVTVDNGTVTISYPLGSAAQYLAADSTWPSTFYNSWEANDPRGIATLVFSGDIESVGEVNVYAGQIEPGTVGGESNYATVEPEIEGNKVILDFTGVKINSTTADVVTVMVSSVQGTNGLTVDFGNGSALYQYINYVNEPAPEIVYMTEEPTIYYDDTPGDETLFIYWNESLEQVVENAAIQGSITTPSGKSVEVTFNITTFYPDASNEPGIADELGGTVEGADNALMTKISTLVGLNGGGTYSVSLPAGQVMNGDGEFNDNIVDEEFEVAQPVLPSTIKPTISYSPEAITISWDNKALSEYNPNGGDILIMPADYSTEGWRLSIGSGVTISNNTLVINIANLDLDPDVTYELIVPEYYVFIGGTTEANEMIDENFDTETLAINSIESVINGNKVIYNLQGQRVKNASKGIFIINGKKVMVK